VVVSSFNHPSNVPAIGTDALTLNLTVLSA
jgi:hypothetical protein